MKVYVLIVQEFVGLECFQNEFVFSTKEKAKQKFDEVAEEAKANADEEGCRFDLGYDWFYWESDNPIERYVSHSWFFEAEVL